MVRPTKGRLIIVWALACSLSIVGFAASTEDKFEVAKTKLLYLLVNEKQTEATVFASDRSTVFSGTEYENDWLYWQGVSYVRNGQLQKASKIFETLMEIDFNHKQLSFEYASVLIKLKSYSKAEKMLTNWLVTNAGSVSGQYYLALSQLQNRPESAVETLAALDNKFLSSNFTGSTSVTHDQVVYLYAASLKASQKYKSATAQLDRVMNWPGGSDYSDSADFLKNSIENQQLASRPWSASVSLGAAYDSNVELVNDGAVGDIRGALTINAAYKFSSRNSLNYLAYASAHGQVSSYNLLTNRIGISHISNSDTRDFKTSYSASFNALEGALWQISHSLNFELPDSDQNMGVSLRYNQIVDDSDSNVFVFGGFYNKVLNNKTDEIQPNILIGADWTLDNGFTHQSYAVYSRASVAAMLKSWQMKPSVGLSYQGYAQNSLKQQNTLASISTEVSRRWSSAFTTRFKVDGFWSVAEPDLYGYQRSVVTANAAWSF